MTYLILLPSPNDVNYSILAKWLENQCLISLPSYYHATFKDHVREAAHRPQLGRHTSTYSVRSSQHCHQTDDSNFGHTTPKTSTIGRKSSTHLVHHNNTTSHAIRNLHTPHNHHITKAVMKNLLVNHHRCLH